MKFLAALVLAAIAGCGEQFSKKEGPRFRLSPIAKTDIVKTVEATGTVEPIKKVEVGAQVNGKIIKLFVDYNSLVTNGQVVALIDPQVYDAQYRSALAQLHANEANVKKCEAALKLAEKTLARKHTLSQKQLASVADYDNALEVRDVALAALEQAKAQVEQSRASMNQAKANLNYCTIVSPVDGTVIERSVDEGQTVVSSMNAVPLLTIAEDLSRIQVEATVPEADVGMIREGQNVTFTADAYRKTFRGKVRQVRLAATTENNVVTYPIIIDAVNDDKESLLFPGHDREHIGGDGPCRRRAGGLFGGAAFPSQRGGHRGRQGRRRRGDPERAQALAAGRRWGREVLSCEGRDLGCVVHPACRLG